MTSLPAAEDGQMLAPSAWKFRDPPVAGFGNAREANDNIEVSNGSVVLLTLVGYARPVNSSTLVTAVDGADLSDVVGSDESVPFYVFSYAAYSPRTVDSSRTITETT